MEMPVMTTNYLLSLFSFNYSTLSFYCRSQVSASLIVVRSSPCFMGIHIPREKKHGEDSMLQDDKTNTYSLQKIIEHTGVLVRHPVLWLKKWK